LRVLHCPEEVGGHPTVLAKYEKQIGLNVSSYSESKNPFVKFSDEINYLQSNSLFRKEIKRWKLILRSFVVPDVLHLNNGRFITPYFGDSTHPKELKFPHYFRRVIRFYAFCLVRTEVVLHRLGSSKKAIFTTFQGSDARETKCFVEKHQQSGLANKIIGRSGKSNGSVRRKKLLLTGITDKIYSLNPDLLEVLPKGSEFLPYATEAGLNPKILPFNQSSELVVGHAPTHRMVKGTDDIIRAVQNLRFKGFKIRLELIEGLSREDAQKKYQEIDLFVDQLVGGWYGVVSLEVMALGKPVICFVEGKGLRFVPPQMLRDLPIINADEITLEEKIIEVMKMDTVQRGNLAERGIRFLQKWHDPRKIAQRVVADYKQVLSQRNLVRV
jgi:glycosyltransferase involved in cell wall biosynthesis